MLAKWLGTLFGKTFTYCFLCVWVMTVDWAFLFPEFLLPNLYFLPGYWPNSILVNKYKKQIFAVQETNHCPRAGKYGTSKSHEILSVLGRKLWMNREQQQKKNSHREIKEQNPTNSSHQRDGRGPGRKGLQRGGTLGLDFYDSWGSPLPIFHFNIDWSCQQLSFCNSCNQGRDVGWGISKGPTTFETRSTLS